VLELRDSPEDAAIERESIFGAAGFSDGLHQVDILHLVCHQRTRIVLIGGNVANRSLTPVSLENGIPDACREPQ
jgi:hypothetical protein